MLGLMTTRMVSAASLVLIPAAVKAIFCDTHITKKNVTTTVEAHELVSALKCTGDGVFDVTWIGSVAINQRIDVSDGISLSISGFDSSSTVLGDDGPVISDAEVDARGSTGIFSVSGGSTLSLTSLTLRGGSSEDGGAVHVENPSPNSITTSPIDTINAVDCKFFHNSATRHGGAKEGQY